MVNLSSKSANLPPVPVQQDRDQFNRLISGLKEDAQQIRTLKDVKEVDLRNQWAREINSDYLNTKRAARDLASNYANEFSEEYKRTIKQTDRSFDAAHRKYGAVTRLFTTIGAATVVEVIGRELERLAGHYISFKTLEPILGSYPSNVVNLKPVEPLIDIALVGAGLLTIVSVNKRMNKTERNNKDSFNQLNMKFMDNMRFGLVGATAIFAGVAESVLVEMQFAAQKVNLHTWGGVLNFITLPLHSAPLSEVMAITAGAGAIFVLAADNRLWGVHRKSQPVTTTV